MPAGQRSRKEAKCWDKNAIVITRISEETTSPNTRCSSAGSLCLCLSGATVDEHSIVMSFLVPQELQRIENARRNPRPRKRSERELDHEAISTNNTSESGNRRRGKKKTLIIIIARRGATGSRRLQSGHKATAQ